MRQSLILSLGLAASAGLLFSAACGGSNGGSGFPGGDGGSSSSSGSSGSSSSGGGSGSSSGSGSSGGTFGGSSSGSSSGGGDGGVIMSSTVYATTDTELYKVDPKTMAVTDIGAFSFSGKSDTITDVAVNSNGDVYVNGEATLYKASVPSGTGSVALTQVASLGSKNYFYALAFAPAGALDGANDTLVGGDGNGALWSIDTSTGTPTQLGTFGSDPYKSGNTFELSGDVVFYLDSSKNNAPTGLATIRSCSGSSSSTCGDDFLAQIDMTALKTAYTSGTPSTKLLYGIYGSDPKNKTNGSGTGYHDVFGLAAWNSTVFGFTYASSGSKPSLITIDTTSGAGALVTSNFSFSSGGWSGAGVTTKVTIIVPPPPPGMAQ